MAQVQDSTIPASPSPDTAIPVWLVPEIDDESALSEETIQRLREPLRIAIPVRVLPGIDDERVSIAIPVRLLPEVRPSPTPRQRTAAIPQPSGAAPVTLPVTLRAAPHMTPVGAPHVTLTEALDETPLGAPHVTLTEALHETPVGAPHVTLTEAPHLTLKGAPHVTPYSEITAASPVTPSVTDDKSEERISCRSDDKGIDMDYGKYEKLRRAAVDDDWHFVKKFIESDREALTAKLSDSGQTILHYMVNSKNIIEFVREVVREMKPEDLKRTDENRLTVLSVCAIVGNKKAAEIIVGKNRELLYIPDKNGNLPLHHAAKFGHKDMVQFLLSKEEEEDRGPQKEKEVPDPFTGESGVKLVENLITTNLYGWYLVPHVCRYALFKVTSSLSTCLVCCCLPY